MQRPHAGDEDLVQRRAAGLDAGDARILFELPLMFTREPHDNPLPLPSGGLFAEHLGGTFDRRQSDQGIRQIDRDQADGFLELA